MRALGLLFFCDNSCINRRQREAFDSGLRGRRAVRDAPEILKAIPSRVPPSSRSHALNIDDLQRQLAAAMEELEQLDQKIRQLETTRRAYEQLGQKPMTATAAGRVEEAERERDRLLKKVAELTRQLPH